MFVMPSGIQRRAPFTPLPTCGISTITRPTSAIRKRCGAYLSHVDTGTRNAITAAMNATTSDTQWRIRNA